MFGDYDKFPFKLENDKFNIHIEKNNKNLIYTRNALNEEIKKNVLGDVKRVQIYPIRPVFTPEHITDYLCIEFDEPIYLLPNTSIDIFLKFPIEIGIFLDDDYDDREHSLFDVFSFSIKKFTLYGEVSNGILCKHYKSPVYFNSEEIDFDYYTEGILRVRMINKRPVLQIVTKIVFDTNLMHIFFNENRVISEIFMSILQEGLAELVFYKKPLQKGNFIRSKEKFLQTKLLNFNSKFKMEYGL